MKKHLPLVLHVSLWLALLAFSLWAHFNLGRTEVPLTWLALDVGQTMLFHLALFYFNWHVLLPKILAKDRVLAYALTVVLTLLVFAGVRAPLEKAMKENAALHSPRLATTLAKNPEMLHYKHIMIQLSIIGLMNIFLSSSLKVTGDYLRNERRRKELELQHANTELELLKAQVNPHFLFNTLNNIYSLAYQNSPSTPDAILKLSLLLRYQLYETDAPVVPLAKEVEHLHHLLDLHHLRLPNPELLTLDVTGNENTLSIPPMLLMPLVENMFKHGLTTAPMRLHLAIEGQSLTFRTKNQVKTNQTAQDAYGGIGLQNLKRRLELLYPNAHSFKTQQQGPEFTATLTLTKTS